MVETAPTWAQSGGDFRTDLEPPGVIIGLWTVKAAPVARARWLNVTLKGTPIRAVPMIIG